ncbi:hypothetical protein NLG97_g9988 [Lecanicillium saksenae]|uniref:Uncharacterized protein n=1 Tax=Lecanicillium saksenae TaxID=468837 RepID=A0ACC1QEP6_9HYPO|nr:hypothetical protein NLG97_g9988 [Lecanicillium saksenae]
MPDDEKAAVKLQDGLAPYIKSREQVNYIRRILAAHLGECAQGGPVKSALALANGRDADGAVKTDSTTAGGVYRDYLDALKENIAARKEFEDAQVYDVPEKRLEEKSGAASATSVLNERVAMLKLHRKRDGLGFRVSRHGPHVSRHTRSAPRTQGRHQHHGH